MTARQLRALRGCAAALIATLISASAHTLAGGGAPSPALVLAIAVLAAPLAVASIGRRPSRVRTAIAVLVSQAVFHLAFAVAGSLGSAAMSSGHSHGLILAGTPMPVMPMHGEAASHIGLSADARMLAAHAVAAIATVILISHGERMLRAIARGLSRYLPPAWQGTPLPTEAPATALARPPAPIRPLFSSEVSRRGPPAFAR